MKFPLRLCLHLGAIFLGILFVGESRSQTVTDEFLLISNRDIPDYLELTKDQVLQVSEVVSNYRREVNKIRQSSGPDVEQRYDDALRSKNRAIRNVLLESQLEAYKAFPFFLIIRKEGLATSISSGLLKNELQLSDEDCENFDLQVTKIREDYLKTVEKAQKAALAQMRDALPKNKRKEYSKLTKSLFRTNGTFWSYNLYNLKVDSKNSTFINPESAVNPKSKKKFIK